jgi:hypothetical protein
MKKIMYGLKTATTVAIFFFAVNANAIPFLSPNADFNHSGMVDSHDAATLFGQFGKGSLDPMFNFAVDMNRNGVVDSHDASTLFSLFGTTSNVSYSSYSVTAANNNGVIISEPATLGLLALGFALALGFSRRGFSRRRKAE